MDQVTKSNNGSSNEKNNGTKGNEKNNGKSKRALTLKIFVTIVVFINYNNLI
jgi:hypothetical protein